MKSKYVTLLKSSVVMSAQKDAALCLKLQLIWLFISVADFHQKLHLERHDTSSAQPIAVEGLFKLSEVSGNKSRWVSSKISLI